MLHLFAGFTWLVLLQIGIRQYVRVIGFWWFLWLNWLFQKEKEVLNLNDSNELMDECYRICRDIRHRNGYRVARHHNGRAAARGVRMCMPMKPKRNEKKMSIFSNVNKKWLVSYLNLTSSFASSTSFSTWFRFYWGRVAEIGWAW